ncbi:MAG: hypothetical protein AAF495_23330 [Pseudomonadota bacterium]
MTQFADVDARPIGPGVPAPLAALLIALNEAGILSKTEHRDAPSRRASEPPETDDFEAEAISCQNLFEYLVEEKPRGGEIKSASSDSQPLLKSRRWGDS